MTLPAGRRLGTYEITAKLGEGGMGEVYRATDTRLKREVAIKVLPAAFTADEERLARFEREAQLLAQLHHPHIASIFGIEEADGVRALVMELVEGPTLAERLAAGPLPLEESLSIARQIAEALEEAHEKGIVHRDLKPQNVKAPADGKVKVLDFGLAKAMDPVGTTSGSASQLAASPTLTLGATMQGMILGTAAYMAPEQAKGMAVDKRADIWAFGVVLYEMLTGARLFAGDSVPDTLAGVLRAEIDLAELPVSTPPVIRRLLRRCLERKPKNRLHDIADARIVLDELSRGEHAEVSGPAAALDPAAIGPARPPIRLLAAMLVAGALLGLAAGWLLRPRAPAATAAALDLEVALAIPPGFTLALDNYPGVSMSADGRRQVATLMDAQGRSRLLLRELGTAQARVLPGTEGAFAPILSPDGESLAFVQNGELRRLSIAGGPSLTLTPAGADFRGGVWGGDGFLYLSLTTNGGLQRLPENGGALEPVTTLDGARRERTHRWPDVLPGGAVLFTSDTNDSSEFYDDARIEAVRPSTGERKVILEGSSQARYLGPDHLLFARAGTLFVVRFDPRELATLGAPVPLLQGVSTDVSSGAVRFATAGETGAAIWIPGELSAQSRRLHWIRADGESEPVGLPEDRYVQLALDRDQRRMAATIDGGTNTDLWVLDLDGGTRTRLTFAGSPTDVIWSPDGRHVAYSKSTSDSDLDLHWQPGDGSGEAVRLLVRKGDEYPGGFTPDGSALIFESTTTGRPGPDIFRLEVATGKVEPLLAEPYAEFFPALSPDGRWLAYASEESASRQILVRRYPELTGKWQISRTGGEEPRWSPEGDALYFRNDGALFRVGVDSRAGFVATAPVRVAEGMMRGTIATTYGVARGGRVLVARDTTSGPLPEEIHFAAALADRARLRTAPKR